VIDLPSVSAFSIPELAAADPRATFVFSEALFFVRVAGALRFCPDSVNRIAIKRHC
jgi:hypothetical protein